MSYADDFAGGGSLLGGLQRSDGKFLNQLSPSAISTLLTCPERFRLSYLNLKWGKANAATTLGNAYHHALQANCEQKIHSGVDLTLAEVLEFYDQGWSKALDQQIMWRKDDPGATKTLGSEMLIKYHKQLSPTVQPIAVEERFETAIEGCDVPLVCKIDVLEAGRILDRKTAREGATKAKNEWRVQALCYMASLPGKDFAWHVQSKQGHLRTYGPDKYPGLALASTPAKVRAGRLLVKRAWEMLQDFYDRYGLDQPWPGVALVHPYACMGCSHRSGCVWQV